MELKFAFEVNLLYNRINLSVMKVRVSTRLKDKFNVYEDVYVYVCPISRCIDRETDRCM